MYQFNYLLTPVVLLTVMQVCGFAMEQGIYIRTNPRIIDVHRRDVWNIIGNGKGIMAISYPVPMITPTQDTGYTNLNVSRGGNELWWIHPITGNRSLTAVFEGRSLNGIVFAEVFYNYTLYDVQIDWSKITTIYEYDKRNPFHQHYTGTVQEWIQPNNPLMKEKAKKLWEESKDYLEFARKAFDHVRATFAKGEQIGYDSGVDVMVLHGKGVCNGFSRYYVSLMRAGGIPARGVIGAEFKEDGSSVTFHSWSEFYLENYGWIPVDATWNRFGVLKNNFVILGNDREAQVWKVVNGQMSIAIGSPYSITLSRDLHGAKIVSHEHKSLITRIVRPPQNIFEAAEKGTVQDVEYFVKNGADVNAKNKHGKTPLIVAAEINPNVEVTKYLITHGADVHAKRNDNGATALHSAAWNYQNQRKHSTVEIMKYLIAQGADVNAKMRDGQTPLDFASGDEAAILRAAGGKSGRE